MEKNHKKGILFAVFTAVLWGFLPLALKVSTYSIAPVTVAWSRFMIAFALLLSIFIIRYPKGLKIFIKPPVLLFIAAIGLTINYVGAIHGVHYTSPSNMQILMQLAPMMLVISGILIFKEKVSRSQVLGMLTAFIGFTLFYGDQYQGGNTNNQSLLTGMAWVFCGALGWTLYAVLQKKLTEKHNPQELNLIIYGFPIFLLMPLTDLDVFVGLEINFWLVLIFLGINTLLAYGSLSEAFRYTDANKIGMIITLNPIITIFTMQLLGLADVQWIDHEKIGLFGLLGAFMVVSGAIIAVRKPKRA